MPGPCATSKLRGGNIKMIWRPYRDHIEMGPPERGVGNRGQQQVMDGWVRGYKLGRRAPLAGCQQKGVYYRAIAAELFSCTIVGGRSSPVRCCVPLLRLTCKDELR